MAESVAEKKKDFAGLIEIIRFGEEYYGRLIWALVVIFGGVFSSIGAAWSLGQLSEAIMDPGKGDVMTRGVWFLLAEAGAVFFAFWGRISLGMVTNEILLSIRNQLFVKMSKLPISYYDREPLGRVITRLTRDVEALDSVFSGTLANLVSAGISAVSFFISMIYMAPQFGFVVVLTGIPSLLLSFVTKEAMKEKMRVFKRKGAEANALLTELISGSSVIKTLGIENWSNKMFRSKVAEHYEASIRVMNFNAWLRPLIVVLCTAPLVLVIFWGGQRVLDGVMELGIFIAFLRLSEQFLGPVRTISREIQRIQDGLTSSERVVDMLHRDEENGFEESADPINGGRISDGKIEFRHVSMSYDGENQILDGVNFVCEPGMSIGLVGETGAGKSSVANLIPRLYEFDQGEILIDGIPIKQIDPKHLRNNIGYVGQAVAVFAGTMRENLLVSADQEFSDEELMGICCLTGLDSILDAKSAGLDLMLEDGGKNLSEGEKQLLALTRNLVRKPKILILDEATANIDEKTESIIQNALQRVSHRQSTIIIAHRLETIKNCDKILALRHGKLIEEGSHHQLMELEGYYARLVKMQH